MEDLELIEEVRPQQVKKEVTCTEMLTDGGKVKLEIEESV